ncbi:uncharacterized membrane protein (UPF0136 family) [Streptacidiphilus sp. BW17]|uniref:DUF2637 domain-containing protein n=1 Tax=unclassified Streptacidiphilus TaxID=2643834 RepID=UPI003519CFCA
MTPVHTGTTAARDGAPVQPLPHRLQFPRDADAPTADIVVGILGVCAFAVSFKHVVQTADRAGQTGWVAYAIAVSVELMAIGAVSELRRRKLRGHPARWPRGVLVLGVVMSLAANLAVAQSTPWGYVMAAWPAVAFLAAAGIIESRPADRPTAAAPSEPADPPAETDEGADADVTDEDPAATAEQSPAQQVEQPQEQEPAEADTGPGPDDQPNPPQPPRQRPTRLRVMTDLLTAMRADPHWRPDYDELTRTTGYGRSWCEKRVAEARTLHQGRPEPVVTEEPAARTAAPQPLSPIRTPRDADDRPVPPTSQPAPNPYEEPAREHHPPHTAATA